MNFSEEMEPLIKILAPSGIWILIIFMGIINLRWEKGSQIAAGGEEVNNG